MKKIWFTTYFWATQRTIRPACQPSKWAIQQSRRWSWSTTKLSKSSGVQLYFYFSEFHRTLYLEDFIDSLNTVEEILEFRQVPDDVRVSLVATRVNDQAMDWWQQFKELQRQDNKPLIHGITSLNACVEVSYCSAMKLPYTTSYKT